MYVNTYKIQKNRMKNAVFSNSTKLKIVLTQNTYHY